MMRCAWIGLLLALPALAEDPEWKKENFAGPLPPGIERGQNGRLELINILGSRRWRHAGCVTSVAFSSDGKRALSASMDNMLELWDVESGKELDSIAVDGGPTRLAVHGDLVVVGNANTTLTLYRWK